MVLVRIAYVADLPTPDEAIRMLEQNGGGAAPATSGSAASSSPRGAPSAAISAMSPAPVRAPQAAPRADLAARPQLASPAANAAPALRITSFPQLIALAGEKRDIMTKSALEADVRLVRIEDGQLEIALEPKAQRALVTDLPRKLELWTGRRWTVIISNEAGQPTVRSQNEQARSEHQRSAEADPRVQEVLTRFPGTKVIEVRRLAAEVPVADATGEDPIETSDSDDD